MPKAHAAIYKKLDDNTFFATIEFPDGSSATLNKVSENVTLEMFIPAVLATINPKHLPYRYTPVITIYKDELEYLLSDAKTVTEE